MHDAAFSIFRGFDTDALRWAARSKFRLDLKSAAHLEARDPLVTKIVTGLAERRAINIKETLESFETFARIRRRARAATMAELCCGHGLVGLLFAAVERRVERVVLLDRQRPPKADLVAEAVFAAAPWARTKVQWVEAPVEGCAERLAPCASVLAIHACGARTDRALDAALALEAKLAVVPCCYQQTSKQAPRALRDALGAELATDVARTYRLEGAGYRTEWAAIPKAITPMNRILLGRPRE